MNTIRDGHCHAVQFRVDLLILTEPLQINHNASENQQHHRQQQRMPGLQSPAK